MKKIGRPRRVPSEVSNVRREITLTPSENRMLVQLAAQSRKKPASYLRDLVAGFLAEMAEN